MLVSHSLLPSSCSDQRSFACTAHPVAQSENHMVHLDLTGFSHFAPILPVMVSLGARAQPFPALLVPAQVRTLILAQSWTKLSILREGKHYDLVQ